MPGSQYLSTRCAASTFITNAQPLLNVLSEESKQILQEAHVLQLFGIPKLPQNIPLLYVLIRYYNRETKSFLVGEKFLKVTVNEISLILGIPNRGREFVFERRPYVVGLTHKELIQELNELVDQEPNPAVETCRVNALVKYLLVVFLFPLKGTNVPRCLHKVNGVSGFKKFNWPKAIHVFLHAQLDELSKLSSIRDCNTSLGYLEGCPFVLLVWLFEHTNLQLVVDDFARPRICRWSSQISYSAKFSYDLRYKLRHPHQNYKACKVRNAEKQVSHVTKARVQESDIILIPCHLRNHWVLLACWLKERRWDYYDSLHSRHQGDMQRLVRVFVEDASSGLPEDILEWPIDAVAGLPLQENGYDCGVFVLKYMEALLSPKPVDWAAKKNWQEEMPRFRAEIAYDIFRTFAFLFKVKS